MTRSSSVAWAALCALSLVACGGSGHGGGSQPVPNVPAAEAEANDTSATANALSATGSGSGTIALGDVDFWSFSATAGSTIQVELHAIRADQTNWTANVNDPVLTLIDTDGVTKLLEHDSLAEVLSPADLDFPAVHVPASGTYFLRVKGGTPLSAGGTYVLVLKTVSTSGSFQLEAEAPLATGGNDAVGTAQSIVPGTVFGWHVDGNEDWYTFDITTPSLVSFEVLAHRNGLSHGDASQPNLQLELRTPGAVLLQGNDVCFGNDPGLTYSIQSPGVYSLRLFEAGGSSGDGEYFLSFSRIGTPLAPTELENNDVPATATSTSYDAVSFGSTGPADPDVYSFFGTAGDVVAVQTYDLANAEGGTAAVSVTLVDPGLAPISTSTGPHLAVTRGILRTTGTHYIQVTSALATPYRFRLTRWFGSIREEEAKAAVVSLGSSKPVSGVIAVPAEKDVFSFFAAAGEVVTISCYGGVGFHLPWMEEDYDTFGSSLQPELTIRNSALAQIAYSTRFTPGSFLTTQSMTDALASLAVTFIAPAAGMYTVELTDQFDLGHATYAYVLERR